MSLSKDREEREGGGEREIRGEEFGIWKVCKEEREKLIEERMDETVLATE